MEGHIVRKQIREDGLSDSSLAVTLEEYGLLLLQDKALPSVVGLITGERVAGSWWSHPRSQEIFRRLEQLEAAGDVVATKLISGKVTFVHRRLWPALAAVGRGREEWQMRGLSPAARRLLAGVDEKKSVHASGPAAKELQKRLLVDAHEEHTASGKHVTVLKSWPRARLTPAQGQRRLEEAAAAIGASVTVLPWRRKR
jgi:hypothetical protein